MSPPGAPAVIPTPRSWVKLTRETLHGVAEHQAESIAQDQVLRIPTTT